MHDIHECYIHKLEQEWDTLITVDLLTEAVLLILLNILVSGYIWI